MGFVNLDLYLRDLFAAFLERVKTEEWVIDDLFSDRPANERTAIRQYLYGLQIVTDMNAVENDRALYIIESFPTGNLPFPQIGIYLGGDNTQDFYLGGDAGIDPIPVTKGNTVVAWDRTEACFSGVNYRADILAGTKYEVIWLSRFCQRAILENILGLDAKGVKESKVSAADLKIEESHFPALVFGRAIMLTAKVIHSWKLRVPASGPIETGVNTYEEG